MTDEHMQDPGTLAASNSRSVKGVDLKAERKMCSAEFIKLQKQFTRVWGQCVERHEFEEDEAFAVFKVFTRCICEGDHEIDKDDLPFVIKFFGYMLEEKQAEAIVAQLTRDITTCSTLSFEEL